ncbi:MAG: hypothetical protein SF123_13220 [Chloroflexota bacterium]|nr:hypothetical protein [Chloroflexota bacterium]
MAFEYEALVGHLYVVGGRAINIAPPGSLVEVAPRKAARGRETDTFFTLVLPGGDEIAPAAFYEQMSNMAAEKYFGASGSVTAALRIVFNSLNDNLYEHNNSEKHRYEASMICAVLRGADLYLARAGSAVALFRHDGTVQAFPTSFDNDDALFGVPLGVQAMPDIKMANYRVANGSRLLMGDGALADLDMAQVNAGLASADISTVVGIVKQLMPLQLTLTAVEFVPPEVTVPVPVRAGESSRALATGAYKAVAAAPTLPPTAGAPQVTPLPVPSANVPPRPRSRGVPLPIQSGLAAGAKALASGTNGALKLLDRFVPPLPEGKKGWFATPGATLAAVLIPAAVVLVVVAMWVTGTGESEFDLCVRQAEEAATTARGIPSNDVQGTINAWNAASTIAAECQRLRPDTPDDMLTTIDREARSVIDQLSQITRRETATVASFPQAGLTRGVLQGQDMYVLDDGNDMVYRITLNPDGISMAPNTRQALAFMRRGVQIEGLTVGDLVDIAWAEDGSGLSQSNVLIAVDENGLLIDCAPRFTDTCRVQQLQGSENWIGAAAISVWSGRLYVLDPAANQLWRYDPNAGAFANAPIEYFSGEGRPDIRTAVDFAIDTEGVVFILLANGTVLKFRGGERLDFAFAGFPQGQTITSVDGFYLNTNPLQPGLYFASRSGRSVYETLLGGTFVNNYRATEESYFESVAAVLVNNDQDIVYALSGNSVFAFYRDESS